MNRIERAGANGEEGGGAAGGGIVTSERVHLGDNLEILFHFGGISTNGRNIQGIMSSDLTHS